MTVLRIVGSSSKGNAYILECNNEILLIEAGIPFRPINKNISYKFRNIVGCIVSHLHIDHAKYIPEFLLRTIPVYSNSEVANKYEGVISIFPKKKYHIGNFYIQCLEVPHNAQCYSYIIDCPDGMRVLFITDCSCFKYKVKGVNVLMIETNYSNDVIVNNAIHDEWSSSASENHLSLEQAIEVIKRHKSHNLKTVIGLHLSNQNSDEKKFSERIFEETGIRAIFADSGMIVGLKKEEF